MPLYFTMTARCDYCSREHAFYLPTAVDNAGNATMYKPTGAAVDNDWLIDMPRGRCACPLHLEEYRDRLRRERGKPSDTSQGGH
jgi:hypothetical protein